VAARGSVMRVSIANLDYHIARHARSRSKRFWTN
jgi:hypothetical protein